MLWLHVSCGRIFSKFLENVYLHLDFFKFQGGLFEDIAEGLRHAKVMVACISDEVS